MILYFHHNLIISRSFRVLYKKESEASRKVSRVPTKKNKKILAEPYTGCLYILYYFFHIIHLHS